ncbi:hypothetical protein NPIL_477531 [Nephila pilipes]|uniref:Uncharacterized protein n=1 Tax=Nephila pilipes TaxID=299642 RepID=A0A8X6U327_NEPPI|nr:hypothetical protein NPIL_477531 [Nephila pilipes]
MGVPFTLPLDCFSSSFVFDMQNNPDRLLQNGGVGCSSGKSGVGERTSDFPLQPCIEGEASDQKPFFCFSSLVKPIGLQQPKGRSRQQHVFS